MIAFHFRKINDNLCSCDLYFSISRKVLAIQLVDAVGYETGFDVLEIISCKLARYMKHNEHSARDDINSPTPFELLCLNDWCFVFSFLTDSKSRIASRNSQSKFMFLLLRQFFHSSLYPLPFSFHLIFIKFDFIRFLSQTIKSFRLYRVENMTWD